MISADSISQIFHKTFFSGNGIFETREFHNSINSKNSGSDNKIYEENLRNPLIPRISYYHPEPRRRTQTKNFGQGKGIRK
jgi:hypothetical protein